MCVARSASERPASLLVLFLVFITAMAFFKCLIGQILPHSLTKLEGAIGGTQRQRSIIYNDGDLIERQNKRKTPYLYGHLPFWKRFKVQGWTFEDGS